MDNKPTKLFLVQWVFEVAEGSSERAVEETIREAFADGAEVHMIVTNLDTFVSRGIGVIIGEKERRIKWGVTTRS